MAEVTALVVGAIVLLLGFGGFTVAWYLHGRDAPAGQAAAHVSAPPDDLSPGLAGVLLDEQVHSHHVLATLCDLARRAVLRIHASRQGAERRFIADDWVFDITLIDAARRLSSYEDAVLFAIFGQSGWSRQPGMVAHLGSGQVIAYAEARAIAHAFYGEMIDRGYFAESPRATRRRWSLIACGYMFAIVALMIVLAFTQSTDGGSPVILVVTIVMVLMSILYGFVIALRMPARTRMGATALVPVTAFGRYLDHLVDQPVTNISQQRFELLLPYVVALRRDPRVLRSFVALDASMPGWFDGDAEGFLALHANATVVFTSRIKGGRVFAE